MQPRKDKSTLVHMFEYLVVVIMFLGLPVLVLIGIFLWEREELNRCTRMNMICKFARKCKQHTSTCKRGIVTTVVIFCVLCIGTAHGETKISTTTVRDTIGCERTVTYTFHMNQAWHWLFK